ncbi:unnamed protein product [Durusdinium trenchii]|uniref:Uncharacterized protein n=1 Tax=Durusdinium trenchii TaxID=1381693 RepID=A0ABP0SFY9_9DINO
MPLEAVDALSDDDKARVPAPDPPIPEPEKSSPSTSKGRGKGRGKGGGESKPEAKEVREPSSKPKAKSKGKAKAKGMPKPTGDSTKAKGEPKVKALKRPAASSTAGAPPMKRPATDPERVSASKGLYKNGVWGIKLNQKEVIRVKPHPDISEADLAEIAAAVKEELIRTKGDLAASKALHESMLNAAKLKAVPARKVEAPALQEDACEGEPMVEGEEEENLEHDAVEDID